MNTIALAAIAACMAAPTLADTWTLDGGASHLAFGSIKNDYTGEVHSFGGLSGSVDAGKARIAIDLASVDTLIEIRDERMIEHVFGNAPKAMLSADLDMDMLNAMAPGDMRVMEVSGSLSFLGKEIDVFAPMFVARMAEDKVLVTTNDFTFVATDELGIDAGIDTLQDLAGLDSITRAVPVSLRLVFQGDGSSS